MKQVLIREGTAAVTEVPAPDVGEKNVLVHVAYSSISVGTEMASVQSSGLPLYQRALKQPANVQRVLEMARTQGVTRTIARVRSQLASGQPTGYSAAGVVAAVGEQVQHFAIGDRVACAGAGIANHAEFIDVPVNLAVRVPAEVDLKAASTVTLGAIALQGVRRAAPTLGETIVVVGLGILGQLTAQMLSSNGCRVIGTDLEPSRLRTAMDNGLDIGIDASGEDYVDQVFRLTDGVGADGVIITAATPSHQVISDAMRACRKKGRVVLVGDVGLNLNRADFYTKELDVLISTSYGPGRYDPVYEEDGQDYPLPYVRWTENRNMQAYLQLLANRRVKLETLYAPPYPIDRAADAYEALKGGQNKPLLALLSYPLRENGTDRVVRLGNAPRRSDDQIRLAVVGASSFAQAVHLPNMELLRKDFELRAVMSRTGSTARAVATRFKAEYCTTDFDEILADDRVSLVMITTRHDLHGRLTLRALRAGKHVFVEKPLTLDPNDLQELEQFYQARSDGPLLMVGYNRRFSPPLQTVREILSRSTTPVIADYRMNAGFLPTDHWVHGREGGGRNLGEACHIYDLFNSFPGAGAAVSIDAEAIRPRSKQWSVNDNFVATIRYENGSVCTLTYTALGDKSYPKERLSIFADGKVIEMDDYKAVNVYGGKHKGWSSRTSQKGHVQQLEALADSLRRGKPWPISLAELIRASRISFEVERQISPAGTLSPDIPGI